MSSVQSLEKLRIWKEAQDLTHEIHILSKDLKSNYPLKDQIDRSSQAVADNIAEMHGSYYYNNKIKGLYNARKEALETVNHIIKFQRRNLWLPEICTNLTSRYEKLIRGINAYVKYVVQWRDKENNKLKTTNVTT